MAAYIEVPPSRPNDADLVVKNFGVTAARDVRFEFSTPLRRASERLMKPEYAVVTIPHLPYLAPGQEWRTWWDSGSSRIKEPDLPKRFDGVVRYRGINGMEQDSGVVLDFAVLESYIYNSSDPTLKDVVKPSTVWRPPSMKSSPEDQAGV